MTRAMKDSGIEWIGEIPVDWEVVKIKHLCNFYNGYAFDSSDFKFDGNCSVIRIGDISQGTINLDTCAKVEADSNTLEKYALKKDDIVIALSGATIGKVGYIETTPDNTYINQRVAIIRSNINKLIYQWLNAGYISSNIPILSNSSAQPNISTQTIGNLFVSLPSMSEQQKIADFLDEKCSHIDSVLEKIRASIDEYKQLKQSIITQAVTKGVRPNRPMKDSGIEWIGEIPQDWEVAKIGNLFNLRNKKNDLPEDKVTLLSLYTGIGVFPSGEHYTASGNHAQTVDGYKIVKKNDIVVNIILAWMGAIGISDYDGVTSPAYDVYIPDLQKVYPHFYHYVFRTSAIAGECYKYGKGIMMMRWRTYSTEFKQIRIPFPPINIQQQIADFLDNKCSEIDKLITKKEQLIAELETYKKSLIYEYVTGKKEVI
ncbi:restriction endonuclease subunit S [Campylobacter devanensis]|uniref:restriction endonuclease subunit S n=1 Tax=Campylobacter devanensis TaxID=3161138 RepID=UPI000A342C53|nr:restriction endonuclease subunit S [Campylobacter sp. P0023]